ncbi:MAG: 4-hydroxy-tetrahydrodipicolinate reductase [Lentimicrobiaceae bacterium]
MKITLAGYGNMGHEIEKIAIERGHSIVAIFDNEADWQNKAMPDCDVIINFSTPATASIIVNRCLDLNIPVVSGTTGWIDQMKLAGQRAESEEKAFFYASNFSIGVNIFFEINTKLAGLLGPLDDYKVNIEEIHHIHKKDAPSGTAITLAEGITEAADRYNGWTMDEEQEGKIKINSERIGEVPGTHIITWNSEVDSIQIKHTAHSRKGFAQGAVVAAEWLQGRKGFFNMSNLLESGTKIDRLS